MLSVKACVVSLCQRAGASNIFCLNLLRVPEDKWAPRLLYTFCFGGGAVLEEERRASS